MAVCDDAWPFASRVGNDFVVSSEREGEKSLIVGGQPPTPPYFFFFSLFFSLEGRASVQDQEQEERGERQ